MRRFPWELAGLALAVVVGLLDLPWLSSVLAQTTPAPGPVSAAQRPRSPYEVTVQAGPWLILAASYSGPHAVYLAEQVVRQLRERHQLQAYLWNFADQQRRQQEEEYNRMQRANPGRPIRRRFTRVQEHCGVFVGGYPDFDSASKDLPRVKSLPPPDVYSPTGQRVEDVLHKGAEGTDTRTGETKTGMLGKAAVNPFHRSFVTRNPSLPRQQVDHSARVDPLWKKLNAGEEYSLLRCSKSWTLVVKYYEGAGVLQSNAAPSKGGFLEKLGFGAKSRDLLTATALQARELAKVLRQLNFEAYVLHTRYGSLVTVGGFDSLEDQNLREMQQKLSMLRFRPVGGQPLSNGHELFAQPMPMRVPRL